MKKHTLVFFIILTFTYSDGGRVVLELTDGFKSYKDCKEHGENIISSFNLPEGTSATVSCRGKTIGE